MVSKYKVGSPATGFSTNHAKTTVMHAVTQLNIKKMAY